ncbi:BREX-1 system phosphatase PglZ type A [Lacticaseibacillus zhaodongensis]|uniref:BREX-1 system phosphatase PglZ type A n=1 Tax=Lacticaseibacillus zhaodongensis TaxID=2668065 RepID=UPI0012D32AD4|nr:BREX-1 system phosphatase PglZ type A [Lacticaseibacillus zhaodongensis]
MAELNVDEIVTGLTAKFTDSNRFVVWYDDDGSFAEDIEEIAQRLPAGIELLQMQADEQFNTKLRLEEISRADGAALVYSPAPEPPLAQNFLADFIRFGAKYTADATAMLLDQLNLPKTLRSFVGDQQKFFNNKRRASEFGRLYTTTNKPELVEMAVLTRANEATVISVLQVVGSSSLDADNDYLQLFAKYGLADEFWNMIDQTFAFNNIQHDLMQLFSALFLNFAFAQADTQMPDRLSSYTANNLNNAVAFIDHSRDKKSLDADMQVLAAKVWQYVNGGSIFGKLEMDVLVQIDAFAEIDITIINWLVARIKARDFGITANRLSLAEIADARTRMNFGYQYADAYAAIVDALHILTWAAELPGGELNAQIEWYTNSGYKLDQTYRHFTKLTTGLKSVQRELVDELADGVENRYLNDFLTPSISNWTDAYAPRLVSHDQLQRNFYQRYVGSKSESRTVVIISDAFRFEAAKELQAQLEGRDMFSTQMDYAITALPSVTYFGMPALLPNHELSYTGDTTVLVDGQKANTEETRRKILQKQNPASVNEQLDNFRVHMNSGQRKAFLAEQKVVYLYHNQIDTTGEKEKQEDETFSATAIAIKEIAEVVGLLRNLSVRNIIITADHGFIYRWSPIDEADKIELQGSTERKEQRYAISNDPIAEVGVKSQQLGELLGSTDARWVSYPTSGRIFRAPGAGQNYVHGGASPQEMIVPVLQIKAQLGKSQAVPVELTDVTAGARRITSREVVVRLNQVQAISDKVTAADYTAVFTDAQGTPISGTVQLRIDSREADPKNRIFTTRFTLTDQQFVNQATYYLVLTNLSNNTETKYPYTMDMMIGGGFGFDIG